MCIAHGIPIWMTVQNTTSVSAKIAKTSSAKRLAASWPSSVNRAVNIGMNAAWNAPSANIRRNKFGNLKATKNASATGPAPSIAAISISRAKPRMRLAIVYEPTVAIERKSTIARLFSPN